jgi:phosphonate transport system substrate-binding protein
MADLEKIRGKRVAFTDESSTSGYLYPAVQLMQAGIDPITDITPIFSGGHDASVAAVYSGDADIGIGYDDARRTMRKTNPDVGEKVIVFNITAEIPNDIIAVSTLMPESLNDAIVNALTAYAMTEEGAVVMDNTYGITDFVRGDDADFDVVKEAAEVMGITEG